MYLLLQFLPLTLGVIGIDDAIMILAIAAMATGTVMSSMAQRQAAKQAEYNADYQAKAEEMAAEEEKARRAAQERLERRQARARRAEIEAGFAASGLLMTGTPTYLLEEQAKSDEMNILEANRVSDTNFMRSMERAKIIRQQGQFESASLKYGATTTLITGLGGTALAGVSAAGSLGAKTAPAAGAGGSGGTAVSGGGGGAGFNNASFGGNSLFAVA